MYRQSIFDQFFQPPVVVVVSEERLKKAEVEAKEGQLKALDQRIKELELYRGELAMEIEALNEPQSLEEALTGE